MQFKISTDYAIRTVLYLGKKQCIASCSEIAAAMSIPQNYLRKILSRLRRSGIIVVRSGVKGGAVLNKKPADICLYDIAEAMESSMMINKCLEHEGECARTPAGTACGLRSTYLTIQHQWEELLKSVSLEDLLENDAAAETGYGLGAVREA